MDQRTLAGAGDAGHRDEHAERHVHRDVLRLWSRAFRIGIEPRGARGAGFSSCGHRGGGRSPSRRDEAVDGALEHDRPAVRTGARAHVDDMVGDPDHLRVVLDDEDRVALVAQAPEQRVHPLDVVGVEPDRRLVEDVRHVGQRRPEVADHPRPLRLASRERPRRPVEAQVAEAHLDERVEAVAQRREQRCHRRLLQLAHPLRQVADLHRAGVGDADAPDLRRPSRFVEPRAAASGQG